MLLTTPNFIALSQTMYKKSVRKNFTLFNIFEKKLSPEESAKVYQILGTNVHWQYP